MSKQLTVEVILTYDDLDTSIDDAIDDVSTILEDAKPDAWGGKVPRFVVGIPESET